MPQGDKGFGDGLDFRGADAFEVLSDLLGHGFWPSLFDCLGLRCCYTAFDFEFVLFGALL